MTVILAQPPVHRWDRPAGSPRDCQGRLLHGYLHKTSNCLCGIKGYASLIARGQEGPLRPETWARKIIAEVERLETIYRSVQEMAFGSPDEADPASPDAALRAATRAAAACCTNLRVAAPPVIPGRLLLPERDLEQVLTEILANSAESRAEIVHVSVETGLSRGGRIYLALADDGPGIAPALLPQVADPFVTTRAGHLGIGLARLDTLMDMYGLGWGLRSAPGAGTVVTLEVARPEGGAASYESG